MNEDEEVYDLTKQLQDMIERYTIKIEERDERIDQLETNLLALSLALQKRGELTEYPESNDATFRTVI